MTERSKWVKSESIGDFLKAVYRLQQALPSPDDRVSTNALADVLNISAPSVTDMARRMVEAALVDYEKYKGVRLTAEGENFALKMIRRHRLIELYLVNELGYALHEVHEEAENLEHAVSDRFVEAVAHKLGHPERDPHGDPIPAPDGTMSQQELIALSDLPDHVLAVVSRFKSENADMVQHILDRGFELNAQVEVIARDPFEGPLTIRLAQQSRVVGHNVAASILVEIVAPLNEGR